MDNDFPELNAPLVQRAPSAPSSANSADRYDAIWATEADRMSARTLSNVILDTSISSSKASPRKELKTFEDEAVAAGTKGLVQNGNVLTSFTFAGVLFFIAGGGPFGTEPSIKAAGNLYAIIGFVLMPIVWVLPEAVMTYEMSLLYPCASGGVRWTEEAFGEVWGLIVGYLGWVSGVADSATCPVLFLSYVHKQFLSDETDTTERNIMLHYGILAGITIILSLVNYLGLEVIGTTSTLICLASVTPFILMVAIGIPKVGPEKWLLTPDGDEEGFDDDSLPQQSWFPNSWMVGGIAIRPFINNMYWNYSGLDQAGHYSNSVSEGTLRNGIVASSFLVSVGYLLVALVATGATDMEQGEWNAGAFAMAATKIAGPWLGRWIVIAAGMSLLAQFISGMSANSLQIQGMAARGQLPSLLSHQSARGTPTCAILLGALVILALLPLPFSILVELENFTYCINVLLEFLAFAHLRIRRDCTIPWKVFYSMMLVVPLLLSVAVLLLSSYTTYIYGASVTAFGIILIYVKRLNYDRQ